MKINKQWNKVIEQKQEIEEQDNINQNNLENINKANVINQYIKKFTNLSTDFVTLIHNKTEVFPGVFENPETILEEEILFFEWIIEFDFLPENLIPYLNIQILYKSFENLPQKDFDETSITFNTDFVIQMEERENQNPKITLIASIFAVQRIDSPPNNKPLEIGDIQAKFLITLQNPNDYV